MDRERKKERRGRWGVKLKEGQTYIQTKMITLGAATLLNILISCIKIVKIKETITYSST